MTDFNPDREELNDPEVLRVWVAVAALEAQVAMLRKVLHLTDAEFGAIFTDLAEWYTNPPAASINPRRP